MQWASVLPFVHSSACAALGLSILPFLAACRHNLAGARVRLSEVLVGLQTFVSRTRLAVQRAEDLPNPEEHFAEDATSSADAAIAGAAFPTYLAAWQHGSGMSCNAAGLQTSCCLHLLFVGMLKFEQLAF